MSLPYVPSTSEADLLSDWFAGWSNSSKNGTVDEDIKSKFEDVLGRNPKKVHWNMYACNYEIKLECFSKESVDTLIEDLRHIGLMPEK